MRVALALVVVAASAAAARAEPIAVNAARCASLDADALTTAIGRELALATSPAPSAPVAPISPISPISIDIACPDGIHARLSIAPTPAGGPLVRDLDLSEEPAALRVKLVALAVGELVDVLRDEPRADAPLPRQARDSDDVPAALHALDEPAHPPARVTVRGGIRVIAGDPDPMPTISAELDVGPARVGLVAAIGDGHHASGKPYFLALAVSRPLACARGRTTICLVARGEAGVSGAPGGSMRMPDADLMSHSVYATYADLQLGVEATRRLAGRTWLAGFDLGAGDGLILESPSLERLDGPFGVATLGTSW